MRKEGQSDISGPRKIGDVISELFARRGYGKETEANDFTAAWNEAVGDAFAQETRCGVLRRTTLQVTASHSTVVQELTFRKAEIVQHLQRRLPDSRIEDIQFRVGTVR